jgi:hypothetical protein
MTCRALEARVDDGDDAWYCHRTLGYISREDYLSTRRRSDRCGLCGNRKVAVERYQVQVVPMRQRFERLQGAAYLGGAREKD